MVNSFTGNDIKKLSGLDDTRVLKGKENFDRGKRIVNELCTAEVPGLVDDDAVAALGEESGNLKERIDKSALFHQVEFPTHLQSEAKHSCCCFKCGFHDPEGNECITCQKEQVNAHKNPCNKCSEMYAVIDVLKQKHRDANTLSDVSVGRQEGLDQLWQDIIDTQSDLDEYRSHVARQVYEDRYDEKEIRNLSDGTVRITSNWKHKILECYYRENMLKCFGKNGTSMLGFILMWNSTDPVENTKGIKEVRLAMMLTYDGPQDKRAVICAKGEIYLNHLPAHINDSIFVADGASCFNSKIHHAVQWLWEPWTGIREREHRITVAGGGKSPLDGMFGRFSTVLSTAVNSGMSHRDATGILQATECAGAGLTATSVLIFASDRSSRPHCETTKSVDLEGVLRTALNDDGSATAYRHSELGGFRIERIAFGLFKSKDTSKKRTIKKFTRERLDADTGNVCFRLRDLIMGFLGEEVTINSLGFVHLLVARHFRANKLTELARLAFKDAVNYGSNVKSEL